jgi:hypothetical protein
VPLPFLTLLFNSYCGNRFFPIFEAYSTEVHFLVASLLLYMRCRSFYFFASVFP